MFEKLRLIDLSVPLQDGAVSEPRPARIHYIDHHTDGLEQMQQLFGVRPDDLTYSGGLGWAVEGVLAITHTGTHVDAPFHYGPLSGGKPARRIDEVPLEWCFCDAFTIAYQTERDALAGKRDIAQRRAAGESIG